MLPREKKLDLVTIGAVNLDVVATVDEFPGPDSQVMIRRLERCHGGSAANTAAAAARLGLKTGFVGKIGEDTEGRFLISGLEEAGVDTGGIIVDPAHESGQVFVVLDGTGDRRMFTYPGAPQSLSPPDITTMRDYLGSSTLVHLASLSTIAPHVAIAARKSSLGALVSLNPGGMLSSLPFPVLTPVLEAVDLLFLSKGELERLFEGPTVGARVDTCFKSTLVKLVVVTLGARGASLFTRDGIVDTLPAIDVPVVDTTGAGDAFTGAFLARFLTGRALSIKGKESLGGALDSLVEDRASLKDCLAWGLAAASCVIQERGARNGQPARARLEGTVARAFA